MAKRLYVSNNLKGHVVFYCKDCERIVDVKPVGRKFAYRCAICNTKNVAFGTEKTVRSFYRVKEEGTSKKEDSSEAVSQEAPDKKTEQEQKK